MSDFKNYITESSLNRLWSHNLKHDCAALTAFRKFNNCGLDDNGKKDPKEETPILLTKKEKMKRNAALSADIKKLKYNVTKIIGKYPEGGSQVKEVSFFLVDQDDKGNLKKHVIDLGKKYNQDSVLFIPKGAINNTSKDKAKLYGTNNCFNNWLGMGNTSLFNKGKIGIDSPIYTSYVNGRPFIFESCELSDILFCSATNAMIANKWSNEYEI